MPVAEYLAQITPPDDAIRAEFLPITWEHIARIYYLEGSDARFDGFAVDADRTVFRWRGFTWEVDLCDDRGRRITDGPTTRVLFPICRFMGPAGGQGRVVEHVYLRLHHAYRSKGIASRLHPRECAAYQAWGAREIQMRAAWEGLREGIWLRMGFRLLPEDLAWLNAEWANAAAFLGEEARRCVPIPDRYADWNEPLRSWFKTTTSGMTLDMYKALGMLQRTPP